MHLYAAAIFFTFTSILIFTIDDVEALYTLDSDCSLAPFYFVWHEFQKKFINECAFISHENFPIQTECIILFQMLVYVKQVLILISFSNELTERKNEQTNQPWNY